MKRLTAGFLMFALMSLWVTSVTWASGKSYPAKIDQPKAATPAPDAPKKSQYNANIYEKEGSESQFGDVVKVIREIDGNMEVVFTKFGTYTAPTDGTAMERLQESMKAKIPVMVTFNEDSRKIMKVGPPQKPEEKKSPATAVPK